MSKRLHRISYPDPVLSPEIQERSRRAAELLREWMAAKDGYDEEIWPFLEEELASGPTRVGSTE